MSKYVEFCLYKKISLEKLLCYLVDFLGKIYIIISIRKNYGKIC